MSRFGEKLDGLIASGVYAVHAMTDDRITHHAELYVKSHEDLAIRFRCRPLVIDGHGDALSHLQKPETPVDCMTCLARTRD